jgi:hypothetical protein
MPLFKRKDKTTIAELEDYYSNQKKNNTGRAWLMAILSLFITLAVLAGLFFGGQWIYQVITNDDGVTVTTSDQQGGIPSFGETITNGSTPASNDSAGGVVSDEAASTSTPNNQAVAGSNTDASNNSETNDDSAVSAVEIPNTGATQLIAVLPLSILVAGYFYSRNRQLKR